MNLNQKKKVAKDSNKSRRSTPNYNDSSSFQMHRILMPGHESGNKNFSYVLIYYSPAKSNSHQLPSMLYLCITLLGCFSYLIMMEEWKENNIRVGCFYQLRVMQLRTRPEVFLYIYISFPLCSSCFEVWTYSEVALSFLLLFILLDFFPQ